MFNGIIRPADGGDRAKQLVSRAYKKIDWLKAWLALNKY